jgi:hypothetical protein
MTLTYARIADRVVADEYAAVSAQIDALYGQQLAVAETDAMSRLRREAHARMLGNGLCTRPVELECRMESACETCATEKASFLTSVAPLTPVTTTWFRRLTSIFISKLCVWVPGESCTFITCG